MSLDFGVELGSVGTRKEETAGVFFCFKRKKKKKKEPWLL